MGKRLKIGCGSVLLILLVFCAIIYFSLIHGPGPFEFNKDHPFKSERAKNRYLTRYDQRSLEWPVPHEDRLIPTSDGTTFVRISGPTEAPALVLLHSASANNLMWLPNIEGLARKFRVYAIDNIYDFGRSTYLREFTTPDDHVNWLDELFTELGLDKNINLAGLSYGGWLTSQYALVHPERLNKVALLAPVATVHQLPLEWATVALKALLPHKYFMTRMMEWMFPILIKSEEGRRYADVLVDDAYLGLRSFKLKMMVNPTVLTDEELAGIEVPVLYMVGDQEVIYPPEAAMERLNRVAPQIETILVENAGHDLTIVQAEFTNSELIQFFLEP